jgi:asparagine synthase (glutamine-hydrolysing)
MCGIAGTAHEDRPVEPGLLGRMCDSLEHRGPDERGIHCDGSVGIAMTRLSVLDLARGGQPMFSEDRRVALVLNGEIYNHRELRSGLVRRGHRLASHSDAEVVVHLWEELGPGCVERLRGMFAFAIWDGARRLLFLARDRLGKKPLHYAEVPGGIVFGSEPRAVLQHPDVPRDVDALAIDAFLVNQYVPHDRGAFAHVHKLPPASTLTWRPGGPSRLRRYWRLERRPAEGGIQREKAAERLRHDLLEATRLRLDADVPLGAFLSGGLDSSLVVAAMAETAHGPVRTFSVRVPEEGFDESAHARRVARWFATEHQELELDPVDASLLPRIAWHFGEPFADPAAVPAFRLAEVARRHVTVVLTGDGGDESFAGYRRYRQLALTRPVEVVPPAGRRPAARALEALAGGTEGRSALPRAARLAGRLASPPYDRYGQLFGFFGARDRQRLYGPVLREALVAGEPRRHLTAAWHDHRAASGWRERAMAIDVETYLPDDLLVKSDITSMAHGLEVRSPLLDHILVEHCAQLPMRLKARGRHDKVLLRDIARGWLPDEIVERPKHGFAVPVDAWLRGPLRELPELLLEPRALDRGLFVASQVRAVIDEHRAGHDRSLLLWALLALELWHRTCVDVAPAVRPELATVV